MKLTLKRRELKGFFQATTEREDDRVCKRERERVCVCVKEKESVCV